MFNHPTRRSKFILSNTDKDISTIKYVSDTFGYISMGFIGNVNVIIHGMKNIISTWGAHIQSIIPRTLIVFTREMQIPSSKRTHLKDLLSQTLSIIVKNNISSLVLLQGMSIDNIERRQKITNKSISPTVSLLDYRNGFGVYSVKDNENCIVYMEIEKQNLKKETNVHSLFRMGNFTLDMIYC